MNSKNILQGQKIAILATHGFEHSELFDPKKALEEAGAEVEILTREEGDIKSWRDNNWGEAINPTKLIAAAHADEYSGVVLPGGVINSDTMRACADVKKFMTDFVRTGRPIAAICHAPWILIEANCVEARQMTSYKSLKTDLIHAGAYWTDKEVVVDSGLVTSRTPKDLPAFNKKMIEEFAKGPHSEMAKEAQIREAIQPHTEASISL